MFRKRKGLGCKRCAFDSRDYLSSHRILYDQHYASPALEMYSYSGVIVRSSYNQLVATNPREITHIL